MIHVICLKHGNLYSADYVNRLCHSVRRNTTHPHRFICYTEDPEGIIDDVEVRPLPTDQPVLRGWWFKVWFFSPQLGINDRILYFDLDTAIVDSINEFFEFDGDFAILRDLYAAKRSPNATPMGSGVMAWRGGWGYHIWETFRHNPDLHMKVHGDQQYLMKVLKPTDVVYWQDYLKHHLVCSYKAHVRDEPPRDQVPPGISVICFHGRPRPHEVPNLPWMLQHWRTDPPPDQFQFPGMSQGRLFKGKPVQFVSIRELQYKPDMQGHYADIVERLKVMDGSVSEQEMVDVFRSMKRTRVMNNPIDVIVDKAGRMVIQRGNQRFCSLQALGFDGTVPVRVWDSAEEVEIQYEPPSLSDMTQVGIYPKQHVRAARVIRMADGELRNLLPYGIMVLTREEYDFVADQIPSEDYVVRRP